MSEEIAKCTLCGEPMPEGEQMFMYHGYSSQCPKPLLPKVSLWRSERIDDEEGEVRYEAHGPKESFVIFEGPNAKADCEVFMKAVGATI